jgi:hypothetical protein
VTPLKVIYFSIQVSNIIVLTVIGTPRKKKLLMSHKYGLENYTEMNIRYVSFESIAWIELAQNLFFLRAFVEAVPDVWVTQMRRVSLPA